MGALFDHQRNGANEKIANLRNVKLQTSGIIPMIAVKREEYLSQNTIPAISIRAWSVKLRSGGAILAAEPKFCGEATTCPRYVKNAASNARINLRILLKG